MSLGENMNKDFAIQSVINIDDDDDVDNKEAESDKIKDEIALNHMAITSMTVTAVDTDESKVNEIFVENESYRAFSNKSVTFTVAASKNKAAAQDKKPAKACLINKSVHFNETNSIEIERSLKEELKKPILKSMTFEEDGGEKNDVLIYDEQAPEHEFSEDDKGFPDDNNIQTDINEIPVEIDEESPSEDDFETNVELQSHLERLKSTGKIEKVAFIDVDGNILSRSVGMDINLEDIKPVLCVLRSPDMSLVKIRIGKQDFTCFKNSKISFVGRAENDFVHVCSCLDFIVICISDPSSPGSCIYEVSRFVKRCYRSSNASME